MKAAPFDPTYLDRLIEKLESMHRYRLADPLTQTDALYYALLAKYYRNMRDARALGKKLVYTSDKRPAVFFAEQGV